MENSVAYGLNQIKMVTPIPEVGTVYENSVGYGPNVPMITPIPDFKFTYTSDGTTEGEKTIEKFKEGLAGAENPILFLYKEAMEENGIKAPPWARLKFKFNVEATKLYHNSVEKTAALLYKTSDPLEYNLKIDYRRMKNPAIRSNITHEFQHALEFLFRKNAPEYVTEDRVIKALEATGDREAVKITKTSSGYIGEPKTAKPREKYPMYV